MLKQKKIKNKKISEIFNNKKSKQKRKFQKNSKKIQKSPNIIKKLSTDFKNQGSNEISFAS